METLTEQLKLAVRNGKGSQAETARACRVSPSSLSRFLSGRGGLSLTAANRLAAYLGVVLVNEDDWRRRETIFRAFRDGRIAKTGVEI